MYFGDDEDLLGGDIKGRFFEILYTANRDIAIQELDRIYQRVATLELIVEQSLKDIDDLDKEIKIFQNSKTEDVEVRHNSLYIESMGNIVTANE